MVWCCGVVVCGVVVNDGTMGVVEWLTNDRRLCYENGRTESFPICYSTYITISDLSTRLRRPHQNQAKMRCAAGDVLRESMCA